MSTEFEEDGVTADYFDKVRKYVDTLEPSSTEATLFHAVKDMPDEVVMVEIGEHAVAGEMDEEEVAELAAMTPAPAAKRRRCTMCLSAPQFSGPQRCAPERSQLSTRPLIWNPSWSWSIISMSRPYRRPPRPPPLATFSA